MAIGVEIRTFEGDFESLVELLRESWQADYGSDLRFHYSQEFLRWNLTGPGCDPELLIGAYHRGRIAGFCARLPRTLWACGAAHQAALGTFLTTGSRFRRQGIGKALVEESMTRLRERGYAGYLAYLQRRHASTPLYRGLAVPALPIHPAVRFYVRLLDGRGLAARWNAGPVLRVLASLADGGGLEGRDTPMVRSYERADLPQCLDLVNARRTRFAAARQWSEAELDWRLSGFARGRAYVYVREGRVRGFANFYAIGLSGKRWGAVRISDAEGEESLAFVDHLECGEMTFRERQALVSRALLEARAAGNTLAIVPTTEGRGKAALLLRDRFLLDIFTPPVVPHWIGLTPAALHLWPGNGGIYMDFL